MESATTVNTRPPVLLGFCQPQSWASPVRSIFLFFRCFEFSFHDLGTQKFITEGTRTVFDLDTDLLSRADTVICVRSTIDQETEPEFVPLYFAFVDTSLALRGGDCPCSKYCKHQNTYQASPYQTFADISCNPNAPPH